MAATVTTGGAWPDGIGITHEVVIRMPVGIWERGSAALLAPAQPLEVV